MKSVKCAYLIIPLILTLMVAGCSSGNTGLGTGFTTPDIDDPAFDDSLDGEWFGNLSSYNMGGVSASISPMTITETDEDEGTTDISGTMTMQDSDVFDGETGTVSGTNTDGQLKFTATFATGDIEFTGTAGSVMISGTFTLYQNGVQTDSGTLYLSKTATATPEPTATE